MALIQNTALRRMRAGELAIGFGLTHLRTSASALIAQATGYDWLFVDMEHGAFSVHEATQICLAALPTGVTPIVRVCVDALDEGTRALDNGAMGLVIPHVDDVETARRIVRAFRYPPDGRRSWGGSPAMYGYVPPGAAEAQAAINREIMICGMIECPEAVERIEEIAAVDGIDCLMIGTSDLSAELGVSGQIGHEKVQAAYRKVAEACRRHGRVLGMGGVYDEQWARMYIGLGARFILGMSDHGALMEAFGARSRFLRGLAP